MLDYVGKWTDSSNKIKIWLLITLKQSFVAAMSSKVSVSGVTINLCRSFSSINGRQDIYVQAVALIIE